jgi:hypothetical protein
MKTGCLFHDSFSFHSNSFRSDMKAIRLCRQMPTFKRYLYSNVQREKIKYMHAVVWCKWWTTTTYLICNHTTRVWILVKGCCRNSSSCWNDAHCPWALLWKGHYQQHPSQIRKL